MLVGDTVNFTGGAAWLRENGVNIIDLADPACIDLMARFIRENPSLWNEDIGEPDEPGASPQAPA